MIEVQNVSMRFNLGIEKNASLKQMAVDVFSKKSTRTRRKKAKTNYSGHPEYQFLIKKEKGKVVDSCRISQTRQENPLY